MMDPQEQHLDAADAPSDRREEVVVRVPLAGGSTLVLHCGPASVALIQVAVLTGDFRATLAEIRSNLADQRGALARLQAPPNGNQPEIQHRDRQ